MGNKHQDILNLSSYNSSGSRTDRLLYIQDIFNDCDILLIQEHWLFHNKLSVYKNLIDCEVHGTSSIKADQPHWEAMWMYRNSLETRVNMQYYPIELSGNRVCAILI